MENLDRLIISLLDSEANKGCFRKELAEELNIPVTTISDVKLKSDLVDGVLTQSIQVKFNNVEISKKKLMKLDFKSICNNTIIFEVGDTII